VTQIKVGNTYKDQGGKDWKIVYEDDKPPHVYLGVWLGETRWFDENGVDADGDISLTLPTTKHEGWVTVSTDDLGKFVLIGWAIYPTPEKATRLPDPVTGKPTIAAKITWESPE
jgi:hypothetical protein